MEKNIFVVDESGKEYEATYPKRAKGLVKNGRARFIDENTICLACPPNTKLEDKIMSENKSTVKSESTPNIETLAATEKPLTAREIFDKIVELQSLLTRNVYASLHSFAGSISSICEENEENEGRAQNKSHAESEGRTQQIAEVSKVYLAREATYSRILAFYERMYSDIIAAEKSKSDETQ